MTQHVKIQFAGARRLTLSLHLSKTFNKQIQNVFFWRKLYRGMLVTFPNLAAGRLKLLMICILVFNMGSEVCRRSWPWPGLQRIGREVTAGQAPDQLAKGASVTSLNLWPYLQDTKRQKHCHLLDRASFARAKVRLISAHFTEQIEKKKKSCWCQESPKLRCTFKATDKRLCVCVSGHLYVAMQLWSDRTIAAVYSDPWIFRLQPEMRSELMVDH